MTTQELRVTEDVVRTTISLPASVDRAIRDLAEKHDRPLSREIRRAIDAHLDAESAGAAA